MEKAVPKTFFINDLKQELAHSINDKSCCMLAEIAGFLRFSGSTVSLSTTELIPRGLTAPLTTRRHSEFG